MVRAAEKAKEKEEMSFEAAWAAAGDEAAPKEEEGDCVDQGLDQVAEARAAEDSTFEAKRQGRRGSVRLGWAVAPNAI